MRRALHRFRRLFAVGILLAFTAAWVLPAQACGAMGASGTSSSHADCGCPDPSHCGQTMAADCAASMLPAAAPVQSLDKAASLPILVPDYSLRPVPERAVAAPAGRVPLYSPPSTVSIRFCTFQE